jgi:Predicted Zn-dependent proteases
MRRILALVLPLIAVSCWDLAAQVLHLKSGRFSPKKTDIREGRSESLAAGLRRLGNRSHLIIQFPSPLSPDRLLELSLRGARVVDFVPENAVLVSVPDDFRVEELGAIWVGRLRPADKISPQLQYLSEMSVVVDFHRDVEVGDVRALASRLRLRLIENPDLQPYQLLVQADPQQIWELSEWDEVAYIYPASNELRLGVPARVCLGAITDAGTIGQYVARIGEGWDGPGRSAVDIGYHFVALTEKLPGADVRSEVLRAFAEWARHVQIRFVEREKPKSGGAVDILFGPRNHGDDYPFDGVGGVLAHTFYPAPPNPEPIAGDMHFDGDEDWNIGANVDLFTVALHEIGHALGLGHADTPGSVMYPFYREGAVLTPEDIAAIQDLYAVREVEPGDEEPEEEPKEQPQDEPEPLELNVTQPAGSSTATRSSYIPVSGVVSGGSGIVRVSWVSDRLGSGFIDVPPGTGAREWSFDAVPLQLGENRLTITALDQKGGIASQTLTVNREAKETPPPPPQPPSIQIYGHSGGTFRTAGATIQLKGSAFHPAGISRVRWENSRGGSGEATGKAEWSATITLQPGINVLTVTAWSLVGTSASRSLSVEYAPGQLDTTAPTLIITSPGATNVATSAATISIRGLARDDTGVTEVSWSVSTGASGVAEGTQFWGPIEVPLVVGTNVITIRASDAAGNRAWRTLHVTRRR